MKGCIRRTSEKIKMLVQPINFSNTLLRFPLILLALISLDVIANDNRYLGCLQTESAIIGYVDLAVYNPLIEIRSGKFIEHFGNTSLFRKKGTEIKVTKIGKPRLQYDRESYLWRKKIFLTSMYTNNVFSEKEHVELERTTLAMTRKIYFKKTRKVRLSSKYICRLITKEDFSEGLKAMKTKVKEQFELERKKENVKQSGMKI